MNVRLHTGYVSEITNIESGKRYLISTAKMMPQKKKTWQTAVFKKRFGPLKFWFPKLVLNGARVWSSELYEDISAEQHCLIETLVHKVPPTNWEAAKASVARWIILRDAGRSIDESKCTADLEPEMLESLERFIRQRKEAAAGGVETASRGEDH